MLRDPDTRGPRVRHQLGVAALLLLGVALPSPVLAQANPLLEVPRYSRENSVPNAPAPERPPQTTRSAEEGVSGTTDLSATEIIRSLAPIAGGNPGSSRQARDVDGPGGRKVRVDYGRAVDLTVFFPYDSATLTPQAQVQLEPLGRALQGRALSAHRFLIGGHTDAAGELSYNRKLSRARAHAVRAYLIEAYGIAPGRLLTYGWGQSRPKDPTHPLSGINRRVEVALVAPRAWLTPDHQRVPSAVLARWENPAPVEESACPNRGLRDPRELASEDLDDFAAVPTELPCQSW